MLRKNSWLRFESYYWEIAMAGWKMQNVYTLSLPGMFFEVAWLNLNVLPLSSVDQICSVVEVCLKLRTSNDWNLKKCQHIVIMFSFIPLALRYGYTLYVKQKHLFCTSFWDILLFFIFCLHCEKRGSPYISTVPFFCSRINLSQLSL